MQLSSIVLESRQLFQQLRQDIHYHKCFRHIRCIVERHEDANKYFLTDLALETKLCSPNWCIDQGTRCYFDFILAFSLVLDVNTCGISSTFRSISNTITTTEREKKKFVVSANTASIKITRKEYTQYWNNTCIPNWVPNRRAWNQSSRNTSSSESTIFGTWTSAGFIELAKLVFIAEHCRPRSPFTVRRRRSPNQLFDLRVKVSVSTREACGRRENQCHEDGERENRLQHAELSSYLKDLGVNRSLLRLWEL